MDYVPVPDCQQNRSEVIPQDVTPESVTSTNMSPVTNPELVTPSEYAVRHNRRDIPFASSTKFPRVLRQELEEFLVYIVRSLQRKLIIKK